MKKKINEAIESLKEALGLHGKHEKEEKLSKEEWLKREAVDWGVSIAVAVIIYFVIMPAILGTSSPMVVVSSCSEQPYLNIGNVIILQGTSMENVKAPTVNIRNTFNYSYNEMERTLTINDRKIQKNTSNDIVVYYANPTKSQIIHRALIKLNTTQGTYLLTQGDANDLPDQVTNQKIEGKRRMCISNNPGACISTPITEEMIAGKKIGWRIPLAGHFKLFFCDIFPLCDGHSNLGTNYKYKLTC